MGNCPLVWNWRMTAWRFPSSLIGAALLGLLFCGLAGLSFEPAGEPAGGSLPQGLGDVHWGMTAEELGRHLSVQKIDTTDQFSYAEHMEREPDVYVGTTADGKRVEYYLYDNALYKLFIIHARNQRDPQLYRQMVKELTAAYGPARRTYEEKVFGLRITHTVWQDAVTQVDLRYGGGFVFEVHVDRILAAAKQEALKRKKSI
jgi:hypothetical protein